MPQTLVRTKKVVRLTIFLAAVFVMLPIVKASIIPTLASLPTPDISGNWDYSYTANLQEGERLDPNATDGVTCPSLGGLVSCNPAGTFFTIYDVEGYVSSSTSATGWYSMAQLIGVTPSTLMPVDAADNVNVTFFYTGPVVSANGAVVPITGFQIVSTLDTVVEGWYTSQATKDAGIDAGTTDQTVGRVLVPNNGPGSGPAGGVVPEPGTASMLLLGCAGVIASLHRKRS